MGKPSSTTCANDLAPVVNSAAALAMAVLRSGRFTIDRNVCFLAGGVGLRPVRAKRTYNPVVGQISPRGPSRIRLLPCTSGDRSQSWIVVTCDTKDRQSRCPDVSFGSAPDSPDGSESGQSLDSKFKIPSRSTVLLAGDTPSPIVLGSFSPEEMTGVASCTRLAGELKIVVADVPGEDIALLPKPPWILLRTIALMILSANPTEHGDKTSEFLTWSSCSALISSCMENPSAIASLMNCDVEISLTSMHDASSSSVIPRPCDRRPDELSTTHLISFDKRLLANRRSAGDEEEDKRALVG